MELTNKNRPVTFKLPDDDEVALVPWEYIIDRLTLDLEPINDMLKNINTSLTAIDTKLSGWIEED